MKVLVFEDNLFWSSRLMQSLRGLGHEAVLNPTDLAGDAAIVNLGAPKMLDLVSKLKAAGTPTIAHAGHKEKDLHQLGKDAGCDILATNGQLTFKLEGLLKQAQEIS